MFLTVNLLDCERFHLDSRRGTPDENVHPICAFFDSDTMNSTCPRISQVEDVNSSAYARGSEGQARDSLVGNRFLGTRMDQYADASVSKNPYLYPRNLLVVGCGVLSTPSEMLDRTTLSGFQSNSDYVNSATVWWLAHTKPRQEKKFADQLARMGIPHYLPVEEHKALTRGRTRVSQLPSFPGYLFLWCDIVQRVRALETNRLVALHPIDDGDGLRSRLSELADLIEKGAQLTVESLLVPGREFRVKAGLFKDKEGTVIKRGGKTRLFVFVSEVLGGVSMEIEEHFLEPI